MRPLVCVALTHSVFFTQDALAKMCECCSALEEQLADLQDEAKRGWEQRAVAAREEAAGESPRNAEDVCALEPAKHAVRKGVSVDVHVLTYAYMLQLAGVRNATKTTTLAGQGG